MEKPHISRMNAAVVQSREVQTERREGSWTEKRNNPLLQKWLLLVKGPQLWFPHIQGSSCSRADCPKPGKSLDFGHGLTPVLTYGQVLFTEAETLEEVNHQHWQIILQITARYGIVTPCWHVRVCTVWWVKPMFTTQTTFMVSECVFVCVCFSSAGKKAAIFIYVNPWSLFSWMTDTFSVLTLSTSPLLRHSAKVSYSHEDRLLCTLLTILGSEPSGKRSVTIYNNERVNLLSEFLGAWGLPFPQLCIARSTEYHCWQAKRNSQKFVIKTKKKSLKFWFCFHLTN